MNLKNLKVSAIERSTRDFYFWFHDGIIRIFPESWDWEDQSKLKICRERELPKWTNTMRFTSVRFHRELD